MTREEAQGHVDRLAKAMNSRDMDALMGLYDEHYVAHARGHRVVINGRAELKRFFLSNWGSFSDVRFTGEVLAVDRDSYTCLYGNSGTHDGVFLGKAATGKRFESWGLFVARVKDGRIVESWTAFDELGQRVQLGLLPDLK